MPPDTLRPEHLGGLARSLDELTRVRGDRTGVFSGIPKIRRILVAIDGSDAAYAAADWAGALARHFGATVRLYTVAPPRLGPHEYSLVWTGHPPAGDHGWERFNEEAEQRAQSYLDQAARRPALKGVKVAQDLDRGRNTARHIIQAAKDSKADLIVMGAHGQTGLDRMFLGSVANAVKHRAPCSVLLARGPPPAGAIVAGADGSKESLRAVRVALAFGGLDGARVSVVHVEQRLHYGGLVPPEEHQPELDKVKDAYPLEIMKGRLEVRRARGRPAVALMATADEQKAGLLVVGSRGRGTVGSALLGSTSDQVSHQARQSVLVVRGL